MREDFFFFFSVVSMLAGKGYDVPFGLKRFKGER